MTRDTRQALSDDPGRLRCPGQRAVVDRGQRYVLQPRAGELGLPLPDGAERAELSSDPTSTASRIFRGHGKPEVRAWAAKGPGAGWLSKQAGRCEPHPAAGGRLVVPESVDPPGKRGDQLEYFVCGDRGHGVAG